MDRLQREPHFCGDFGHLLAGVSRIATAVVKKIPNVMSFEDFDKTLVFGAILFDAL
jgi:hypothetical protein